MISFETRNLKSVVGLLALTAVLTGCASSGNPLAKLAPSNIKKAYNRQKTGLEDPAAVHQSYAEWQEIQGNLVEARKSYQYVLEHDSKSVGSILGLARLDQLAGNEDLAEKHIQKAQSIAPNDPGVKLALGKFYTAQGRHAEAVDELRQASLHSPNEKAIQYQLGVALARSGDIEASRPHFIRTVGEAESHFNIAFILNEQGHWGGAEQELMSSLQKKPQLQESQMLLEKIRRDHAPNQMLAQQQQFVDPAFIAAQQMAMQQQMAVGQPGFGSQNIGPQQMVQQQPYGVQNPQQQAGPQFQPYMGQQQLQQAAGQQQQPQVQQLSGQQSPGQKHVRDAYWQSNSAQPGVNPFQHVNGALPGQPQLPSINSIR